MKSILKMFVGIVAVAMLIVGLFAPLPAKAGNVPESDDVIRFALYDWTAQQVMSDIIGKILDRAGYNTELVVTGYVPSFQAVMDGDVHVGMELWEFASAEHLTRALESGNVEVTGDTGIQSREGLVYPAYMEEHCPGLPNWEALAECVEVFGTPETLPKGRIVDYPADWGYDITKKRIAAYFGDSFVMVPGGSEGAMIAEIKSATARKQPLLSIFFTPSYVWALDGVDLKFVNFTPAFEAGCDDDPSLGAFPDRTADCDFATAWIRNMVWAGMKDKWPVAYNFVKSFKVTNQDYASWVKRVDNDGEDQEEVADSWIDENETKWRPWLESAMAGS